ncbi:4-hydroxy-tetrahydrodipicolinate synthase [Psychroflexus sp. ALD_RP9]|uniref:4-hydroxy-tetrahydrodipicolinate synthase n=1 Tax=Psychroflexus sp. ALD_RP9 TaxID=2777186 RepID=UPI001A8C8CA7|nr:4-hydroxy-tetrahydrodipicolinate synthase [Psychroflexus sp. ALD_RP9]QSS96786.1 4-hydroxy-tetrahydrodipicolinate synthase [Psychroflexus sp. ALD_RP9]
MYNSKFTGTGVALVTPFKSDLSVDYRALERLVNYQIDNGIDYIVVLGTTAESATLTNEEKERVKQTIIEVNQNRVPLVLGVGSNNTQQLLTDIKSTKLDGFDAILSVSPFYNKPTQEGIYQHFASLAKVCDLPIILYNVPGRTGSNMQPSTVVRLAKEFNQIIGIKEAAGDLEQAMTLIRDTPEDFLVISGDDMITLPMVLAGGAGVISVMAEAFPKEFSAMVNYGLKRDVNKAFELHYQLMHGIQLIFKEGNPAGIKAAFKHLDLAEANVRLPLVEASKQLKTELKTFIDGL